MPFCLLELARPRRHERLGILRVGCLCLLKRCRDLRGLVGAPRVVMEAEESEERVRALAPPVAQGLLRIVVLGARPLALTDAPFLDAEHSRVLGSRSLLIA